MPSGYKESESVSALSADILDLLCHLHIEKQRPWVLFLRFLNKTFWATVIKIFWNKYNYFKPVFKYTNFSIVSDSHASSGHLYLSSCSGGLTKYHLGIIYHLVQICEHGKAETRQTPTQMNYDS